MNFERISLALAPPRLLPPISAWLGHIPFAMALVDLLRPRQIVELGTHMGASYAALCQAVASLGLDTQCTAVDTWCGDEHAGRYGPEVLAQFRAHHDPLYGRFSRLLQMPFDQAAETFPDGSIDLLHIDGLHTFAAVQHDLQTWLPRMSPSGVILLHDTQVRERDFGVWKIWEDAAARYPSFEFTHGFGLGLLFVGPALAPGAAEFLAWTRQEPDFVRTLFCRLGHVVELARTGAALGPSAAPSSRAEWRTQARTALALALESLLRLPGAVDEARRAARLEALLDLHAPSWRRVSVVIPTLNGGPVFGKVLQALRQQAFTGELDLVVVDSGSRDDTVAQARNAGAVVLQIPPEQFNHGATRNLALEHAAGDLVVLLTQDAVPADVGMVAALVGAFADPEVAGVYGRQLPQPEHGSLVAGRAARAYAGGATRKEQRISDAAAFDRLAPWQRMELCVFDNVCAALRRSVWRQAPFPRTDFAEDMAWARAALRAGWKIVYEPAARVWHSHARGWRFEYHRHAAHAQAMRRLFAFQEIPQRRQLPLKLARALRQEWGIIAAQTSSWRGKCVELALAPGAVAARVLGTCIGGRRTGPPHAAGQVDK